MARFRRLLFPALPLLVVAFGFENVQAGEGIVLQDGRAVANATVTIAGRSGSARTDRQGHFRWGAWPRPPFEVLVILPDGQYSAPVPIRQLPADGVLQVEVVPVAEHEIVVTSGVTPNIEVPEANARNILRASDLGLKRPVRVVEAVADLTGVNSISEGQAAVPAIRGLARGRTLVLMDGSRVTTERRVGPSATFVDPFLLEGIEVARGPGSMAYGSDAFGGVIHMRTRKPRPGQPLQVRLATGADSGVRGQTASLLAAQGFENWAFLVQGAAREFQDYESPLGRVTNSGAKSRNLAFSTVHRLAGGLLTVGWQTDLGRDIGRPRTNSQSDRFFYPEEESNRFATTYEFPPFGDLSRLKMDFFVGRYRLLTTRDRLLEQGRSTSSSDVGASDFGLRILGIHPLPRSRIEFGVDLNGRFGLEALDSEQIFDDSDRILSSESHLAIEDATRFDAGLFTSAEVALARAVRISGGLRFDQVSTTNRGGEFGFLSTSAAAVSGFGSLGWNFGSGLSLTGQVSRGFRDPTLSDRYFQGLSGRGTIIGNPLLVAETSLQYDLAARYRRQSVGLALYAYRYRIQDLIERYEAEPDMFRFRNRGAAVIRGVEAEADFVLSPVWNLALGAQWVHGEADARDPLADIPARGLSVALSRRLFERARVEFRSTLLGRQDRPGPGEIATPGYARLDAVGKLRLSSQMVLVGQVRNLLDKDYPASPDSRAPPAPGRSGGLTLLLDFR